VIEIQIDSNSPIYIQIAIDIKEQILSNKFIEGGKLPSVRELAAEYEVTALRVQRAMQQIAIIIIVTSSVKLLNPPSTF
jgi:Predicted transcriptional regulators